MNRTKWPTIGLFCALLGTWGCSDDVVTPLDSDDNRDSTSNPDGGGDTGSGCRVNIVRINGQDVASVSALTAADDRDPASVGIQVDVEVSHNVPDGQSISLDVTAPAPTYNQDADASGTLTFEGVTIGASLTAVLMRAVSQDCDGDDVQINVEPAPDCFFESPIDGAALGDNDDKTGNNNTFDYDVVVRTVNGEGGSVVLTVDGVREPAVDVGSDGRARFNDTVLNASDSVALSAELTVGTTKRTCTATVAVQSSLSLCRISFTPDLITTLSAGNGLGIAQDSDATTSGIQTTIAVETETGVDTVRLLVDGNAIATVTPTNNAAAFENQTLADGTRTVQAECVASATQNTSPSQLVSVDVDSEAPPPVTELTCTAVERRSGEVSCSFTEVGPGVGQYRVRYRAGSAPDDASWDGLSGLAPVSPVSAGQAAEASGQGLPDGDLYFAIRTVDNVLNQSALNADASSDSPVPMGIRQQTIAGPDDGAIDDLWGQSMAVGDFNCDGFADLAVGDPGAGTDSEGAVRIYLGSSTGLFPSVFEKTFSGSEAKGRFGAKVVALEDFNGDTTPCADLAVLADHASTSSPASAKVFVYLGQVNLFDRGDLGTGGAELVLTLGATPDANDRIGRGLASAGDFNGDGETDLIVSYRNESTGAAGVYVVHGDDGLTPVGATGTPTTRELSTAEVNMTGGLAAELFASSVCGGQSVDGDTGSDLLIGARSADVGGVTRGKVYVVSGCDDDPLTATPDCTGTIDLTSDARVNTIEGIAENGAFGEQVAIVGDIDGDTEGTVEFAVSDPGVNSDSGKVYVFRFGTTTPTTASDAVMSITHNGNGAASDRFGASLACAGSKSAVPTDVNGDGLADIIVGLQNEGTDGAGVVYVFDGQSTLADITTSAGTFTRFSMPGTPVQSDNFAAQIRVADTGSGGDGFADLFVGAPGVNSNVGSIFIFD